jgi:hypothetical protein
MAVRIARSERTRHDMTVHRIRTTTAAALCALAATSRASSAQAPSPTAIASPPTSAAISVADLRQRLSIIAADSMEGREAGRRGATRTAQYLAAELKRLGLVSAGASGSYLQPVPLVVRAPDPASTLVVGNDTLRFGDDFVPYPRTAVQTFLGGNAFGGAFSGSRVPVIYGGRIGAPTLVDPALVRGAAVLFGEPASPGALTQFFASNVPARYADAAVIAIVRTDAVLRILAAPRDFYADPAHPWPQNLPVVAVTARTVDRMLGAPAATLSAGARARGSLSGHFGYVDRPTETPAVNVAAILPGSDPRLRDEYVAIGAHYDHVGMLPAPLDHDSIRAFNQVVRPRGADDPPRPATADEERQVRVVLDSLRRLHPARPDSINNGADDDGSGTALMLELAESFATANVKPRRSLLFVFHTAEEKGLYGAQYFTDHPPVPLASIVAQINMDQMGRGGPEDAPPGGPNALVVIGSRRLSTGLGDLAERVNSASAHPFRFDYAFDRDGDPTQAYCRSDHYMYARYGIPVAFFSAAAWHRDYHMVSDEAQYVAYDRLENITRYVGDLVLAVANLDHRPVVDKPKPDPNGTCVQ